MERILVTTPAKTYPIVLEQSFEGLSELIKEQKLSNKKL